MTHEINKNEYRIENHMYRWTIIDDYIVDNAIYERVHFALMESSIGDEAPCILVKIDEYIRPKTFRKKNGEQFEMLYIPEVNVIDDQVYDDIITALEDNGIL